jgi:hypothetical protein
MTTKDLLEAVVDENNRRNEIAASYALALAQADPVEWAVVNRAIMERWSKAGLIYIKERAWKLYEKAKQSS